MKRLVAGVALLVWLSGGAALALDQVGSPTATVGQGEVYVALDSNYSERDLDVELELLGEKLTKSSDLTRTTLAVAAGYGVLEGVEVFVRLGASMSEAEGALGLLADFDAEGDGEFTAGAGVRVTLWEPVEGVKVGTSAQVNWHRLEDGVLEVAAIDGEVVAADQGLDVDLLDVTVALGVSVALEPATVYGGIMASWMSADADYDLSVLGVSIPVDVDVEEDGNVGGFLGATCSVMENVSLTVNGHLMDGGWGVGGAIVVKL